jgi:hypothetical protein
MMVTTGAFAKITGGEVYGRFFLRLPPTSPFPSLHHNPMMTLGIPAAGMDGGVDGTGNFDQAHHLQFAAEAVSTNVLVWQTDDSNILPSKDQMGEATTTFPKAGTWTCVEFHVSKATGALETWIDETAVAGLTFSPGVTAPAAGVNNMWKPPSPFAPTSLGFTGIQLGSAAITTWIDDVALAATRIHCQ